MKVNIDADYNSINPPKMKTYMYVNGLWLFLFVCLGLISASQGIEKKELIIIPEGKKNNSPEDLAFYDSLKTEIKELNVKAKEQRKTSPVKRIIRKYLSE